MVLHIDLLFNLFNLQFNISTFLGQTNQLDFNLNIWFLIINWIKANPEVAVLAQLITAIGVIIALIISIYNLRKASEFQKKSIDSQETFSQYQRLIAVYELVNNVEEREARKNIYNAYRLYYSFIDIENGKDDWDAERQVYTSSDGKEYDDIFRDPLIVKNYKKIDKDVEKVRATLDHIGSLFIHNLIPKETLLSTFWGAGLRCWECLESNIMIERDKRGTKYYMNNFGDFVKEIRQYMKDNRLSLKFY